MMTGKVAFVTSGSRGLGHAIVQSLLETGWDVYFTYHKSETEAAGLLEEASRLGRRAVAKQADLLKKPDVIAAVRDCQQKFGPIDALVHNFGPFEFRRKPLVDYTDARFQEIFDGNLTNLFWMLPEVIPGMRRRAFGRIVTIGFDGSARAAGWRFRAPYAAAKAGLAALTRSLAREERQSGITANMVCPGDIRGRDKMHMIRDVERPGDPLGRPPVGEDVARMVAWLCAAESQQVNGTVTEITGGYDILAYDDGKDVVQEPHDYRLGDTVKVLPWKQSGTVIGIEKIPNRYVLYTVQSEDKQGSFTAFQLTTE